MEHGYGSLYIPVTLQLFSEVGGINRIKEKITERPRKQLSVNSGLRTQTHFSDQGRSIFIIPTAYHECIKVGEHNSNDCY